MYWFGTYLSECTQVDSCAELLSSSGLVICAVLQRSILGPLLFCISTRPLEQFTEGPTILHCFYADDIYLYLSLDPCDNQSAMARLNSCLVDTRARIAGNFLKLNYDKTKLLLIGNPAHVERYTICRCYFGIMQLSHEPVL